ncbi:MAG: zinc-dependent metalloprotease, partial [Chitinophagaceae bacterium]|nr:zinc-dependent metalloprotease [Chitinophagaceae bacterium]
MKKYVAVLAFTGMALSVYAQKKKSASPPVPPPPPPTVMPAGPKPDAYGSVITEKAITHKGLFTVHEVEGKYYFELPNALMRKEILAVTRFTKTPGGGNIFGGELANQQVIYWEKGKDNTIFMRVSILLSNTGDSTQAISKAVRNSNLNPIVASFNIKALSRDSNGVVIDVTDFFKQDNQIVSLKPSAKQSLKLTMLSPDKSYIDRITTFPINTEVHTVKTFAFSGGPRLSMLDTPLPSGEETGFVTLEMNTSFLLLPEKPMRKRYFDERVGFFADEFSQYEDSLQSVKKNALAVRWRLEPKPEDMEKFKRGELVEPKKPIVYYIDPATPKQWRKYLMAGITDWQVAFEAAGFKNAIQAKEWPENDTTMSMEDARYSVLRYLASSEQNAYGPNVHDPRSGEILESHIGWFHNVMKVLHDWYMVQAGAVDPRARKMVFDEDLMGQLIRFVSSHEVGHTLGLRHNMGASFATPVEKLRDRAWLEKNGHTASIMDYARFNYVAQPEDNVGPSGIFPRIGDYDKWAIEWGYKPMPETGTAEEERSMLIRKTTERLEADPRLWFGGEGTVGDPRSNTEDLGDNAMKASTYGIRNLERIIKGLPEWTKEEGDNHQNLKEMYNAVLRQYSRYLWHVMKNIGGSYFTVLADNQKGKTLQAAPRLIQKEAIDFLDKQFFTTP